jgi:transcriptional regulator
MDETETARLLASGAADVVVWGPNGLEANFLPLFYQAGSLTTHIGKINPFTALDGCPAVAIFNDVNAFIRSEWLSDSEHNDCASWNYLTVHAYGTLRIHTDDAWMTEQVMAHSIALEPSFDPNSVSAEKMEKMLRAMAGFELIIERVEAKAKMSQNKSPDQICRVITGLRETGCPAVADWMESLSLPRALEKEQLLAGIRQRRK